MNCLFSGTRLSKLLVLLLAVPLMVLDWLKG